MNTQEAVRCADSLLPRSKRSINVLSHVQKHNRTPYTHRKTLTSTQNHTYTENTQLDTNLKLKKNGKFVRQDGHGIRRQAETIQAQS